MAIKNEVYIGRSQVFSIFVSKLDIK